MSIIDDDYEFRTFEASGREVSPETGGWLQADAQGFHAKKYTPESLSRVSEGLVTDARSLTGAYAKHRPDGSLPAEYPVATFATFEKSLNVGGGRMLPAHLISSVTVRPTHRRRGLLRRMMTDDLAAAQANASAIAALTASEGSIYRRFGFGPSVWHRSISVATDAAFRLLTVPRGRCDWVDARELEKIGPQVFARFHAGQTGSVDRHVGIWHHITGMVDSDGSEDRSIRAALHYDEAGAVDGYVSYRFTGWEPEKRAVKVVDFVAADDNAALGLWQYLASIDLVDRVTWNMGRTEEPLALALDDPRRITVKGVDDWLWLRILDVPRAFEARPYASDGEVVFRVVDELGHASGVYRLTATDGTAQVVHEAGARPDLEVDAWVLGSLYLGGVDPRTLAAAGQLTELTPGAVGALRGLLAPDQPVYGITPF